jgi:hypothetical protein
MPRLPKRQLQKHFWACDIKWGQVVVQASRLPVVAGWKPAPQPESIASPGKKPHFMSQAQHF